MPDLGFAQSAPSRPSRCCEVRIPGLRHGATGRAIHCSGHQLINKLPVWEGHVSCAVAFGTHQTRPNPAHHHSFLLAPPRWVARRRFSCLRSSVSTRRAS